MTNSADPDQLASKPTDLDLHCLQMQGISGLSRTRVNFKYKLLSNFILSVHYIYTSLFTDINILTGHFFVIAINLQSVK